MVSITFDSLDRSDDKQGILRACSSNILADSCRRGVLRGLHPPPLILNVCYKAQQNTDKEKTK